MNLTCLTPLMPSINQSKNIYILSTFWFYLFQYLNLNIPNFEISRTGISLFNAVLITGLYKFEEIYYDELNIISFYPTIYYLIMSFYLYDTVLNIYSLVKCQMSNYPYLLHHIVTIIVYLHLQLGHPELSKVLIDYYYYAECSNIFLYITYLVSKLKLNKTLLLGALTLETVIYTKYRVYHMTILGYNLFNKSLGSEFPILYVGFIILFMGYYWSFKLLKKTSQSYYQLLCIRKKQD